MMMKHSQLLPSPIDGGMQPLALTPADETPGGEGRMLNEGGPTGEDGAYGGASAADGSTTPDRLGHSPGSDGGGRILALDSAFKNHGPRKLQMPHQGQHGKPHPHLTLTLTLTPTLTPTLTLTLTLTLT